MKQIKDYNNKQLSECFVCDKGFTKNDNIALHVELEDKTEKTLLPIVLEKKKFLSYCGTRFAKVDQNEVIHIFKDYLV